MNEGNDLIQKQFSSLSKKYKGLELERREDGSGFVRGNLHFNASYDGVTIEERFAIELTIPAKFPLDLPEVKETVGRIPQAFHHYDNGTLCLGVPLQIRMTLKINPTLLGFVEDLIIPYLYSFSYLKKYGYMPYGELSHGGRGIIECYQELLNLQSVRPVLDFLRILAQDNYRGHHRCPCGSSKKLRFCHGQQIKQITTYQALNEFASDYAKAMEYLDYVRNRLAALH